MSNRTIDQRTADLPPQVATTPLWSPKADTIENSNLTSFIQFLQSRFDHLPFSCPARDYEALHKWSVTNKAEFWSAVWDFHEVKGNYNSKHILSDSAKMPGARWFEGATLNFAENLLQGNENDLALIATDETGSSQSLTYGELRENVAALRSALQKSGVCSGDRVAGFLPNSSYAVIAMLATASLGAIWSSCSPDFGLQGVIDRFGQIQPKVLIGTNGYRYNGKLIDTTERVRAISDELPSLQQLVVVPFVPENETAPLPESALTWSAYIENQRAELEFTPMPFSAPLYIMYSSGTTGVPKCIVHSAGGTLLQHLKELSLHADLKPNDRMFYYTTCGWMMWNWLISALAVKATVVLYDGSPFYPDGNAMMDLAETHRLTIFGSSAKYFSALEKGGFKPKDSHDFSALKSILSTGSPLSHESFDYIYRDIKADICLSSISGGTDIISCFALGNTVLPVYRGELQCIGLGMDVHFYDDEGNPVTNGRGELICRSPFPSMPVGFWNDSEGKKYHDAYFSRFENTWAHGDFGETIIHGQIEAEDPPYQRSVVIHGRSDAVLNPGGVRIGTAEIYRQVEKVEAVLESIAVGQKWLDDVRVILFVRLRDGIHLDDALTAQIKSTIRQNTTPRHVPAKVIEVADIPRTISGKIVELAVRNIIHGEEVKNKDALANPEALDLFSDRPELKT
ncbi:acetoacetyl-CoA synthetase [Oleiphilus messinensis]|uniref:Acetoacetyl-CoA synthetase n=1 Tax=Oleiphilus messinensis TaxID=141451 RepID=A0A1Y0IBX1_9GAMM|nr:acetoacetate--CoA ligase [Oleiphilus messinensis]ARU56894.1 acetoacetyl-CoA synthetase [Oleiphilus messinensis]